MHFVVSLGTRKMQVLEERLHTTYDKYVDIRKIYEEEMKRSYVLEQLNKGLEGELKTLKTSARPITKVIDQEIQIDDTEVPLRVADTDYEMNISLEIEKRTLKRLLAHRIEVLKLISQSTHYTFLTL